jgi:hypothetical protein
MTIPSAAATIGERFGQAISIPECIAFLRIPNLDEIEEFFIPTGQINSLKSERTISRPKPSANNLLTKSAASFG